MSSSYAAIHLSDRGRPRWAYTLTELLATMVIVAVLIALIIPSLRRGKEAAQLAQCMENQRDNGISTLGYVLDNDGSFPRFFYAFSPGASGNIVILIKPKKAREAGIIAYDYPKLVCPADAYEDTVPVEQQDGHVEYVTMSYGYNIALPLGDRRYTQLPEPARTLLFYDGSMSGSGAKGKNVQGRYRGAFEFAVESSFWRHRGDLVAISASGHVETLAELGRGMIEIDP